MDGAGGAYTAWRAAADGRSVCVFERAGRPGGRIHSMRGQGPRKDLVVEAGGYRFAPEPVVQHMGTTTWYIDTPLTAAIIKELELPSAIYNPNASEWDHGMHKLVDARGEDVGYLTFIERMLHLAEAKGAHVHYNSPVVGLGSQENASGLVVRLQSGEEYPVRTVLLNLPQRPLIELLRRSDKAIASQFPKPLYNPISFPIMKLYVHYDDAWWRNDLNLVSGAFYNRDTPEKAHAHIAGVPMDYVVPLQGQYHDGDVRCDLPDGRCRGFLQAFYGGDSAQQPGGIDGAIKYFEPFVDGIRQDSAVELGRSEPQHRELLDALHASLVAFHHSALEAANATSKVAAMRPTGAVLSIWSEGVAGINAGCHTPKRGPNGEAPAPGTLSKAALQPLPGLPIFVANEAYGTMNCFAEGSLAMAESALRVMNVSLPPSGWLTDDMVVTLLDPKTCAGRPPSDPFLLPAHHYAGRPDGLERQSMPPSSAASGIVI